MVSSITEGDDKPEKYPSMFRTADLVVLNKIDLVDFTDFSMESFARGMKIVRPEAELLAVSARTGEGFDRLLDWIMSRR